MKTKNKVIKGVILRDFQGVNFFFKEGEKITIVNGDKTKYAILDPLGFKSDIERRYINVLTGKVKFSYSVLVNGGVKNGTMIGDKLDVAKWLKENKTIFNFKNLTSDLNLL